MDFAYLHAKFYRLIWFTYFLLAVSFLFAAAAAAAAAGLVPLLPFQYLAVLSM